MALSRTPSERHWSDTAIALAGLFLYGSLYEPLRALLGHDGLLMATTLVYLLGLRLVANLTARALQASPG